MRKLNKYLLIISLLIAPLHVYGASFNCAKSATWTEKTICSDSQLSDLDDLLMVSYTKALSRESDKAPLKTAQREWLKSVRNTCQDKTCLSKAYTSRLAELNNAVANAAESPSVSGKYIRYFDGKPDKHSSNITVRELGNGKAHITGSAIWVSNANTGNVNMGDLDGELPLEGNQIHYTDGESEGCRLTITFAGNGLEVSGDNMRCGGLNVSFNGYYKKSNPRKKI
ncbi:DUF1311 domain-containing protein [Candidatus Methylospira mobilis]|uniref:DUF1311 domain-containing protein n=1 Tax=Candidatus Methylospira mobilis TaxID=1808979 RepID=A0A5Q0BHV9_9GAMM|nr:lysozyme inhibitor LprI family protein [Candidatus Methylospira mobilis]QFY43410.1 DUF1311 domain-containing protein [Candidatus Methylospira mobilis]